MAERPGWPGVSGEATFLDIRRVLAGQVVKSAAGVLRKGLLPTHTNPVVTGTATMNVSVGEFVAVLDRTGALFLANDGARNVLLSSAPASGSRWSVIYAKQQSTAEGDAVNGPIIARVESTASEAAARALLPSYALELAVVRVNAGSANTNAAGVTITQTIPYTAMEGGTVLLRNQTEQDAWLPHDGSHAYRLDTAQGFVRVNGAWIHSFGKPEYAAIAFAGTYKNHVSTAYGPVRVARQNGRCNLEGVASSGAANFAAGTTYTLGSFSADYAPQYDIVTMARFQTVYATVTVNAAGTIFFAPTTAANLSADQLILGLAGIGWTDKRLS